MDRPRIFSFTLLLTLGALALVVAAACGISTRATDIKRVPWSTAHGSGVLGTVKVDFYTGVQALVIDATLAGEKTETKIKWDETDCKSDYCKNCKGVSKGIFGLMVIAAITLLVSMANQSSRGFGNDSLFQKLMGVVLSVIVFALLLAAMGAFANRCYNKMPTSYAGIDVHKKLGAGFIMTVVAAALQLVVLLAHCIVPAPESTSTFTERLTGRT